MSLTPADIKDLRRKLSEATPGLWIDMGDTEPWPGTVIATTVPDGGVTPVCIDPEADDRPADRACIAALHNAAPALLDAADALATVTRERDEARKALATEEHNHELTIARRDDAQSWADSLANQIAEAADHEIGEHSNLNNPWDNAQDGLVKLVRERDELRAALLNERGEGEPPSEGWARNDFDRRAVGIAWYRPSNADGSPPPAGAMDYAYVLWVYREPMEPEWTWECEHADFSSRNIQGKAPTAREAMRAADTALAGAKS